MIIGDSLKLMQLYTPGVVDLVLADPPYGEFPLINESIAQARRISKGASLYFMYAEDIFHLEQEPDQICFWVKPQSTKNTSKKYSRFVEVLVCYDLHRSPFNQDTHWSTRSGVFFDSFSHKQIHPFQKPDSLIEKILAVHAKPNDLIMDPFAGSGTVERVAKRMDIECISIELDPKWQT